MADRQVQDRPWYEQGSDPDYRFTLANERTFLAWVRTALGLLAAGVALEQFGTGFRVAHLRTTLSVLLAALGLAIAVGAYRHWVRAERAMRLGQALPRSRMLLMVAVVLSVAAVGVTALLLAELW